jgi:hypothetical protein
VSIPGFDTPWHLVNDNEQDLIPFEDWLKSNCVSRSTGWRYRQAGIIETVNRFGKLYVTRAESQRFSARQQAGEFARSRPMSPKMAGRRKTTLLQRAAALMVRRLA